MHVKLSALVLSLTLWTSALWGHPHEWVDWGVRVELSADSGSIDSLRFELTWDQAYSSLMLMDFPQISEKKMTDQDRTMLSQTYGILSRGKPAEFIHVSWNGKSIPVKDARLVDVYETVGKATLVFLAPIGWKFPSKKGELRLSVYDSTYYTDIGIRSKSPVVLTGKKVPSYQESFEQDKKNAYYGGQVYPQVIVVQF